MKSCIGRQELKRALPPHMPSWPWGWPSRPTYIVAWTMSVHSCAGWTLELLVQLWLSFAFAFIIFLKLSHRDNCIWVHQEGIQVSYLSKSVDGRTPPTNRLVERAVGTVKFVPKTAACFQLFITNGISRTEIYTDASTINKKRRDGTVTAALLTGAGAHGSRYGRRSFLRSPGGQLRYCHETTQAIMLSR